jgi:hypothetical protein
LEQPEQLLQKVECPKLKEMYALSYTHDVVLNIDKSDWGGEEIHVRWENTADTSLYFWIVPSGDVSQEGLIDYVGIYVDGWHTTPSKECPVNYIGGTWILEADITGKCQDGIVKLTVKEHFVDTDLAGSCDEPMDIPGASSAPETEVTFNLSVPGSTTGSIEQGEEGGFLRTRYLYTWYPAFGGENIPPLPTP